MRPRTLITLAGLAATTGLIAATSSAPPAAGVDDAWIRDVESRFAPGQPAVILTYQAVYRFLGMNIKRMGTATVRATGGRWTLRDGSPGGEVSLVVFSMDSLGPPNTKGRESGLASFHNRVACVLTMPELNAVLFSKRTNQRFRIPWQESLADHTEIYDLESGALRYWRRDHQTGQETTNLVCREELAREGREVCKLMNLAADANRNNNTNTVLNAGNPFFLYIRGELVPYAAVIRNRNVPVEALDISFPCLQVWAYPSGHVHGRRHETSIWATSFEDFCHTLGKPEMVALAGGNEKLLMVPLIVDFDLAVGSVRGRLTAVSVGSQPQLQKARSP